MKKLRFVLLTLVLLLLPLGILFGTQWGLQFVVTLMGSMSGGRITVGSIDGRLATAYTLGDIKIMTQGADVDIEEFHWSWKPFSLLQSKIDIDKCTTTKLTVQLKSSQSETKEANESPGLPGFLLPVNLLVEELSLKDVKIVDSDGLIVLQIDTFTTSLELFSDRLVIKKFALDGPDFGLHLQGKSALKNDLNLDIVGDWWLVGYGFHPSKGTFSLSGPVNSLGVNVSLNDPGEIHVVGVISNLLDNATWTADVDARNVNLETWIWHCPPIQLKSVHGDMFGDFSHYRGLVVADGYWGVADDLHLVSEIDGGIWGIVFNSLRIDRHESSAVATNASISWEQLFSWEADLDFQNFAMSMFFPEFDGKASSTFHSIGDVTEEEGLVASFALKSMEGSFSDYVWSASGNIGLTEERIFSSDLSIKSDSIGGRALVRFVELSWIDKLSWKTDLEFDQFDPGFLHPEIAGKINGRINSFFEWQEDLPVGSLAISDLSGTLRGADLYGGGTIAIDGDIFTSSGLELRLDGSRLYLLGTVDNSFGLEFTFDSPDLSTIAGNLGGSLSLSGQVTGNKNEPEIGLQFNGNSIHVIDNRLGSISGYLQTSLTPDGAIDGEILVRDSSIKGYDISKIGAKASGTRLGHRLHAEVQGAEGSVGLDLLGKYEERWSGVLSGLTVLTQKYGNWAQLDSAPAEYSSEHVLLQDFCFSNSAPGKSGKACISANLDSNEEVSWSVTADLNSFDLKPFSEMDFGLPPVTGAVDATLLAKGNKSGVNSAKAAVSIPEFDTLLHVTDTDFVSVQLRESSLNADLVDQNLKLNLFIRSNKGGTLGLTGKIANIGQFETPFSENDISGELRLDKYYLSSLSAFTGYGVEPTGWVSSSFGIVGTLAQPEIYGKLAIQEGGLELPYQGISLQDVVISIDAQEFGAFIRAEATSGGGKLGAKGYITHGDEGVEASLKLVGEDFLLVNLPEYSFRVNPDTGIKINKNRGQIDGRLEVTSGLIAPEELNEAIKVSDDVVYLDEEKAYEGKGYPFFINLDVALGDDVKVDGYGLKGRLGGELNVKVTPADFITGRGELDLLDSTFTFYGRTLDIERGRILFTGGPIDNPGVDIRAQKTVTAKTAKDGGYTVGVDINGLVQDLQYRLSSDPYMEDTEILSQMVVGHSFASSSEEEGTLLQAAAMTLGLQGSSKLIKGVGNLLLIDDLHLEGSAKKEDVSLVVGKQITEDLYIGYDMNMFSQLGQFRVRYDLSHGFYVETRSSSESQGADFIYTFER